MKAKSRLLPVARRKPAQSSAQRKRPRARPLQRIVQSLRTSDPDILEIVQFGSSVYAPRLARDLDLMVTTRAKKDEDVYWDAVADWHTGVDVLVREPGQGMSQQIALAVLAFGKTVYGNGQTRREAREYRGVPSYDDAWMYITMADRNLQQAHQERGERFRDGYYRLTFDLLFDAARYAVMTFLATNEKRWGRLANKLTAPYNKQFREFISVLHVQYSYDDLFPFAQADEKFQEWRGKVSAFIEELAERSTGANQ